jgi:cell division protein FtsQ
MLDSMIMRRSRNKKRSKTKTSIFPSSKQFWYISLALILIYLALWCWLKLHDARTFPINSVKIEGNYRYLDRVELQNVVLGFVNKGFFAIDLPQLKNNLLQIPWISQITVWRVWPATLIIHVDEKQAVGRWGNSSLITAQGEVFTPNKNSFPTGLPEFVGPVGSQLLMLEAYQQMNAILAPLKTQVAHITLSSRQSWKIQLQNNVEIVLGREAIYSRLSRFVEVYPQLFDSGRLNNVNYIDTRYANGISVHWKQVAVKSAKENETLAMEKHRKTVAKDSGLAHSKSPSPSHNVVVLND